MTLLFALTLFVSAFLLFWVQPLAGKMLLPLLGGTPAVWNTCLLFFQAVLLAGYAYVLAITRWLSTRAQIIFHAALLVVAGLALPFAINETSVGGVPVETPVAWLLKTLLLTAGLPFFALSASAPLLQNWFSRTRARAASDPYFLYAASNAGSLLALLSFPSLLEPALALRQQSRAWAFAYAALAALVLACAALLWRTRATEDGATEKTEDGATEKTVGAGLVPARSEKTVGAGLVPARSTSDEINVESTHTARDSLARDGRRSTSDEINVESTDSSRAGTSPAPTDHVTTQNSSERLTLRRRLRWALLAFVPSSLVLGVTTYITTDVAAVPLLWVIPLSLYLLSFVVVFARRQIVPRPFAARLLPGAAVLLALVYLSGATEPTWFLILFHLLFLFAAALACHGQLADERPPARHLAEFYLWLAVGGAAGGLFNAIFAPLLFKRIVEYPLAILLASYLRPAFKRGGRILGLKLRGRGVDEGDAVINEGRVAGEVNVKDDRGSSDDSRSVEVNGRVLEDRSRVVKDKSVVNGDDKNVVDEDERRARLLDFLLPAGIGALTAALVAFVPRLEIQTIERIALALGVPLFMLNHFFAPRPLRFALGLAAVMLASALFSDTAAETLHASRNFFGALRVQSVATGGGGEHWLHHGSTLHGRQFTNPARACEPLSYYHREGPLGAVFAAFDAKIDAASARVAVVGLGAGTTAAYARAGEAWTFYEIDPAVVAVARDPRLFNYLTTCAAAPVGVVLGDARLRLRDAAPAAYDIVVLDAFSSDAVPAHLMTREALALYFSKLSAGGLVVFHVSNRSLDLERVVGGLARDARLVARVFNDTEYKPDIGKDPSTWVVVARSTQDLGALDADARWKTLDERKLVVWRDDFSNVISVFKGF